MEFAVSHSFQSLINEIKVAFPKKAKLDAEVPEDLCEQLSQYKDAIAKNDPLVLSECPAFVSFGLDEVYAAFQSRERANFWKKLGEITKVNALVELSRISSLGEAVTEVVADQGTVVREKNDRVVVDQMQILQRMMNSGRLLDVTREFASSPEKLRKAADTVSQLLGVDITPLMENAEMPDFDDPATAASLNAGIEEMMGLVGSTKTEIKFDGSMPQRSLGNLQAKMNEVVTAALKKKAEQQNPTDDHDEKVDELD
jgi:hypothetical protein